MNSIGVAAWVALAAVPAPGAAPRAAVQQDKQPINVAIAPDGERGFGSELSQRDIDKLWSSKVEADRAFLDRLTEVSTEVRVAVLGLRRHYFELGYFKVIAGSAGDDLTLLHSAYLECLGEPSRHLASADARAQAFAAMLLDTRFNARRGLLDQAEISLLELDRVRAVFNATVVGYTGLLDGERKNIAVRGDLAAAELRAMRSDFDALQPTASELAEAEASLELRARLIEIARSHDRESGDRMLDSLLRPRRDIEQRMSGLLFSARVEPKLRALRRWRHDVLAVGADLRKQVLELTPDTPEGRAPGEEIARLGKTERFRRAAAGAVQGLLSDPLDPDLAWAAGHARAYTSPGFDELIYMDRFLALSGLRYSDANPGQGRKLTARELEAYAVIERHALK